MLMRKMATSTYWAFVTLMFCVSVSDWVLLPADMLEVERPTQKKTTKALKTYIAVIKSDADGKNNASLQCSQ